MAESVITDRIGLSQNSDNDYNLELKRLFFEVVNEVMSEMQLRLTNNNPFYNAISALSPSSPNFLNKTDMAPLQQLSNFIVNLYPLEYK